uniref:Uncharacterized protein n=1 Tax=Sphaerodactylus townsendi TaxID=933632 RepID=A0ACB8FZQ5_9SAUR
MQRATPRMPYLQNPARKQPGHHRRQIPRAPSKAGRQLGRLPGTRSEVGGAFPSRPPQATPPPTFAAGHAGHCQGTRAWRLPDQQLLCHRSLKIPKPGKQPPDTSCPDMETHSDMEPSSSSFTQQKPKRTLGSPSMGGRPKEFP